MMSQKFNRIFFRIYIIWFFRRILPLILFQVAVLVIALKIFARKVFVGKVLENAAVASDANYWEFLKYLLSAFAQTRTIIQIVILLALGVGALILRDLGRALLTYLNISRKRNQISSS